ncbi:Ankyrin repeat protein [Pleurostoma richardsiae]|uniref:protein S-acyltransferase n=1 Tax=Pleurostoma richardsiae TaxID=41990 RepID=A0AA38SDP6_9PEZI|nr:Ankyrin repeat protein [Pleurostoma richardsiae]
MAPQWLESLLPHRDRSRSRSRSRGRGRTEPAAVTADTTTDRPEPSSNATELPSPGVDATPVHKRDADKPVSIINVSPAAGVDESPLEASLAEVVSTSNLPPPTKPALSAEMWDEAYDGLDADLIKSFEAIVARELQSELDNTAVEEIAQDNPARRRQQMTGLVVRRQQTADSHKAAEMGAVAIEVVGKFKDKIASSLEVYPPAALAFSGVSLLLDCVGASLKARKANLDGLKYIVARHEWYLGLSDLLLDEDPRLENPGVSVVHTSLRNKILELYSALISYQMKSVFAYYRWNRMTTYLKDQVNWNDWDGDVAEVKKCEAALSQDASMANQAKQLQYWTGLFDRFEQFLELGARMEVRDIQREERELRREDRDVKSLEKATQEEAYDIISRFSLKYLNYEEFKDGINPDLAPQTGGWFKEHHSYLDWEKRDRGLLLLSAPPGCGKSVLARSVVKRLRDEASEDVFVCHFFFKDLEIQKMATNSLCAVLHQLLSNLPAVALDLADDVKKERVDALTSNLTKLWTLFISAVRGYHARSRRTICVLDALDECEKTGRELLVNLMTESFSNSTQLPLKFLVTTRPYETILTSFGSLHSHLISLDASDKEIAKISDEIDLVIDHRLGNLAKRERNQLSSDVIDNIRQELRRVANRTYLWLRLVFELIEKDGNVMTIDWLPETVDQAYEALLSKVNDRDADTVTTILSMIVAAFRPLTVEELVAAYATHSSLLSKRQSPGGPNPDDLDDMDDLDDLDDLGDPHSQAARTNRVTFWSHDTNTFATWLANTCGFIVHVFDGHVFVIHQTVRDFLCTPRDKHNQQVNSWRSRIRIESAHAIMGETCILYASKPDFFRIQLSTLSAPRTDLWLDVAKAKEFTDVLRSYYRKFPFLEYCYSWWTEHVRLSQQLDDNLNTIARLRYQDLLYRKNLMHYHSWLVPHSDDDYAFKPPEYWKLPARGNFYEQNAAHVKPTLAAATGHFNLVDEVLDEIEKGGVVEETFIIMMEIALCNDFVDVVRKLVQSQSCPDLRTQTTKLLRCCKSAKAASWLQSKGLDLNAIAESRTRRTLLHLFCSSDQPKAVQAARRLLKLGVDPNIPDVNMQTALHCCGTGQVARALLKAGAKLDLQDHYLNTPLHVATDDFRAGVVQELLNWHANTELRNRQGQTAMHIAFSSASGYSWRSPSHKGPTIVRSLINAGATGLCQDVAGNTPLHLAVRDRDSFSRIIVQFAISLPGADLGARNTAGQIPLHLASTDIVVELLVEAGSEVCARDNDGNTPLHNAVDSLRFAAARSLLIHGAEVNARNKRLQTPLHLCREPCLARLLIAAGCEVNARDKDGYTSLHSALKDYCPKDNLNTYMATPSAAVAPKERGPGTGSPNLPGTPGMEQSLPPTRPKEDWFHVLGPFLDMIEVKMSWGSDFINADISLLLQQLLDGGADVNTVAMDGYSPLHHAALADIDGLAWLTRSGADLSVVSPTGQSILDFVLEIDDYDDFQKWLKVPLLVSRENRNGLPGDSISLLQHACESLAETFSHPRKGLMALEHLVKIGVDINLCVEGKLPLYTLFTSGYRDYCDLAEFLLEHGADPNAKGCEEIPLMVQVLEFLEARLSPESSNIVNLKLGISGQIALRYLLEHGCDANSITSKGSSALMLITRLPLGAFTDPEVGQLWIVLQARGADVNLQRHDGNSVLHLLCQYPLEDLWGRFDTEQLLKMAAFMEYLLDHKADPNILNSRLETPLFTLLKSQLVTRSDIVFKFPEYLLVLTGMLLVAGADPCVPAACGCTAHDLVNGLKLALQRSDNAPREQGDSANALAGDSDVEQPEIFQKLTMFDFRRLERFHKRMVVENKKAGVVIDELMRAFVAAAPENQRRRDRELCEACMKVLNGRF